METGKAFSLRIYIGSTDRYENQILSEWIVLRAHQEGLAGATVLRGSMGFGSSSVIHSYKFWEIGDKVPVVIEIIDVQHKIQDFIHLVKPILSQMPYGCIMTLQETEVLMYKSGHSKIK